MSGWTDGWDDDDDDLLEDDDDIFVEEEEEEEEQQAGAPIGGGMFMGRLTQFMNQVAPPGDVDDEEDEEEEGSEDEDEESEEEEEKPKTQSFASRFTNLLASPMKASSDDDGWDGDDDDLDLDDGDGWGDDDDFDVDEEEEEGSDEAPEEYQAPIVETEPAVTYIADDSADQVAEEDAWGNSELELDGLDDIKESNEEDEEEQQPPPPPPPPPLEAPVAAPSPPPPQEDQEDAWDDPDLDIDDLDESDKVIEQAKQPLPPPPPPPPAVAQTPIAIPSTPQAEEDAWDDPDLDIDDLDETKKAVENKELSQLPPPPPAVAQIPDTAPSPPEAEEDAWDDTDLDIDDLDESDKATDEKKQPPPPPPALTTQTPVAVSPPPQKEAEEDAWDDPDLEIDDLDGLDEAEEAKAQSLPPPPPAIQAQKSGATSPPEHEVEEDAWDDPDLDIDDDLDGLDEADEGKQQLPPLPPPPAASSAAAIVPPPPPQEDAWDDTEVDDLDGLEDKVEQEETPLPPPPPPAIVVKAPAAMPPPPPPAILPTAGAFGLPPPPPTMKPPPPPPARGLPPPPPPGVANVALPPPPHPREEEDAWDDPDLDIDDLGELDNVSVPEEELHQPPPRPTEQEELHASGGTFATAVESAPVTPIVSPPPPPPQKEEEAAWDDPDLELDDLDAFADSVEEVTRQLPPPPLQGGTMPQPGVTTSLKSDEASAAVRKQAPPTPLPPPPPLEENLAEEAWGDEDLDELVEEVGPATSSPPSTSQLPTTDNATSDNKITDDNGAGWGDNSLDPGDEDGDEDSEVVKSKSAAEVAVAVVLNETKQSETKQPVEPSSASTTSGWDDDGLEDIDEHEELVDIVDTVESEQQVGPTEGASNAEYGFSEEGWGDASGLEGLDDDDDNNELVVDSALTEEASPPVEEASPLVDQVPEGPLPVVQRDSTVAMASDELGTLDEELDNPDEHHFGPVVDHLPPPQRLVPSRTESVATQARFEEMDQDENEVGEDTAPGEASEEPKNSANQGPSVVDHVPAVAVARNPIRDRDSTIAVASQQSSPVMEDVWREDFAPNDEDYGPVVDHLPPAATPTPSVKSIRSMSSLAVQGAIAEEDSDDEETDTVEPRRFGMFSGASVADSLAVVAPIAELDEENTAGQTVDDMDDETASNAAPTADENSLAATREEPLVDHVPLRSGRSIPDASLVLADPSEVSTVGDMTHEEMQYGLVVDHTPDPTPLQWQASAAASVIVAATKSECPDDLEDDMDGETFAMGTGDDGATLETSLGDQNLTGGDPLVDHVPEGPGLRRVNSNSAIAEAQSVISTREDEFGLVVDLTPVLPMGTTPLPRDSVGALVPLSECDTLRSEELQSVPGSVIGRRVEVDKVPVSSNLSRADSALAIRSIDERSEDMDTIEDMPAFDEFGPVVDHLPATGASFALSRGGSTTGALATLSEADFDGGTVDADADGWEEGDQELQDVFTDGATVPEVEFDEFKEETPETRNKSVTFQNIDDIPLLPRMFDASEDEPSNRLPILLSNLGGEDLPNAIPPAPRSANGSISLEGSVVECPACAEATSLDCPCIQRIIASEGDKTAAIVRRMTPDGVPVDVDYNKLLQDEVTKRLLLEKEVEKYEALVDSLQDCVNETTNGKLTAQMDAKRLIEANHDLSQQLRLQEKETVALRGSRNQSEQLEKEKLEKQVRESENQVLELSQKLQCHEGELSALQASANQSVQVQVKIEKLESEARQSDSQVLELLQKLEDQEKESAALRQSTNQSILTTEELQTQLSQAELRVQEFSNFQENATATEVSLRSTIDELNAQRDGSVAEVSQTLETLAQERSIEIERLNKENSMLRQKSLDENERIICLEENCETLALSESKFSAERLQIENLQEEAAQEASKRMEEKEQLLKQESEGLQDQLNVATGEIEMLRSSVNKLSEDKGLIEVELHGALAESARLVDKESQWKTKKSKLEDDVAKLQQMVADTAPASELEDHFKENINILQADLQEKLTDIELLHQKLRESEQQMSESHATNVEQMEESARASAQHQSDVAKLHQELETVLKVHQDEVASLESRNNETQSQLEDALIQLGIMTEEQEEIKEQFEALLVVSQEKELLLSDVHASKVENDKLSAEIQQQKAHIANIEQERDALNESIFEGATKIEDLQLELDLLVSDAESLTETKNQLQSVQAERDMQMQAVAQCEARISSLSEQLEEANVRNEQLQSQTSEIASNHDAVKEVKAKLSAQEKLTRENKERLLEQEDIVSSLSMELEEATEERHRLSKACNKLQETIDGLQNRQNEAGDEATESTSRLTQLEQDLKIATERHQATIEQVRHRDEIEAHLRRDMDMLLSERDSILDEKRELDEDCEEMLVQLGLNKEQMEANEKEITALHDALRSSETANVRTTDSLRAAEESARRMEQMNTELQRQQHENGSHRDAEKSRLSQMVERLTIKNADLSQQVDDLISGKAYNDEELLILTSKVETLRSKLQENDSSSSHHGELEEIKKDLEVRLRESEERYTHLDGVCLSQKTEIDRLVGSLEQAETAIQEMQHGTSASHERVQHLEKQLGQCEEALHQRDRAMQETRQQMEDFRRMSEGNANEALAEMSKTVDELSLRLRDSDYALHQDRTRLQELEAAFLACQEELKQTKVKLSNTEEALLNIELEMDAADGEAVARKEYETLLSEAREKIAMHEATIQQAGIVKGNLEGKLSAALNDLQLESQRAAAGMDQGQNEVASRDQEIQRLKFEILQLQREKESMDAEKSLHDEEIRKEAAALRVDVQKKTSKLSGLEQQVQSLLVELSTSKNLLGLKEDELERVSVELEENRAEQIEATQKVATKVLESDMSKEEAEDTDNMRGLIISLSQALEKSESQRADAIERLLRERKTNADSLRRLGESVKRFYSTLNGASR